MEIKKGLVCFVCDQLGHILRNCPKKKEDKYSRKVDEQSSNKGREWISALNAFRLLGIGGYRYIAANTRK